MLNIIPTPKNIKVCGGVFRGENLSVYVDSDADRRVTAAARTLCRELEALTRSYVPVTSSRKADCKVVITHGSGGEGYTLSVSENGIQTLRQLI